MTDSHAHKKRLATIVAIDVAGYSSLVESDESATLARIQALTAFIEETAKAHDGRLFHTAGDGFMLEFTAVSDALQAADAIRTGSALPLRAGVHIGEVSVTPGGDLLGHGVNVAARLQGRAPVQGVLASADVARAVRSDLSRRLKPAGRIKLDKMRETLAVFSFERADGARRGPLVSRRAGPVWIGVAAVAILAVAGAWGVSRMMRKPAAPAVLTVAAKPASARMAAPRIDILGTADADLTKFTGGLQAEMIDRMTQNRIDVLSPDQPAGGADYVFGGSVEREGEGLLVRLRLVDVRQKVTVWSDEFRGDARKAEALQAAVASEAANVAHSAESGDGQAKDDAETVALLIKADRYSRRNDDADREQEWQNAQVLLTRLPTAFRHANFAVISAFLAATSAPARGAELKTLAMKEADAALKIDPHLELAYFARYLSYPLIGFWSEREAILLAGLKWEGSSGLLTNHESNFLREVGRLNEAISVGRQAAAPRPPTANRDTSLLLALAAAGHTDEAHDLVEESAQAWPNHPAAWNGRLQALVYQAGWEEALKMFAPGAYRPAEMGEVEAKAWTGALEAMRSGEATAKAHAVKALAAVSGTPQLVSMPPHEVYSPGARIAMIATLGGKDEAFAEAAGYLKRGAYADSSFLFWPNIEDFRRDKRFAGLVSSIGLVDYWKKAGVWPDFCADPKLPYDCKALSPKP